MPYFCLEGPLPVLKLMVLKPYTSLKNQTWADCTYVSGGASFDRRYSIPPSYGPWIRSSKLINYWLNWDIGMPGPIPISKNINLGINWCARFGHPNEKLIFRSKIVTFAILSKTKKMRSEISRIMPCLTARDLLYEARLGQTRFWVKMVLTETGIWDGGQVAKAIALVMPNGFDFGYNQFGITTLIQLYQGGMIQLPPRIWA